ncbi:MAG: aminotransferase class V-fold PLP-dependent enzyme, partial [Deltaproteobacteria bacterium]|nr:aminotransferase class V-fold PLP-dependent enzyme [Deltaproteobacteria bacterium]
EEAVNKAREQVAQLIGALPSEVIWTSGATESDNLALTGVATMYEEKGNEIITATTEHHAVLDTLEALERKGFKIIRLPVDPTGLINLDHLKKALSKKTILISLMVANNEIGTIHPIAAIGKIAKGASPTKKEILFHVDAAQGCGKIPIDVQAMGIDLLSMSAHKAYGPKGVGALYVRSKNPRVRLAPILHGGGHEKGFRSGTLPVPNIVGMGEAFAIAGREMEQESRRIRSLRDKLHQGLSQQLDGVFLNGHPTERLSGNLNLSFKGVSGEAIIAAMPEIAISSGSACASLKAESSTVLKALGLDDERIRSSIRFGLGRFNTEEEIDYVLQKTVATIRHLREIRR